MAAALATTAVALAATSAELHAQAGGAAPAAKPACDIDQNSPKDLAIPGALVGSAAGNPDKVGRRPNLQKIMRDLENKPARFSPNPAGYQFTRAQVLTLMAADSTLGLMPTRGALGLSGNPSEKYDIVAGLDTAFKAIVAAIPACEPFIEDQRQNDIWLMLTTRAVDMSSNAEKADSAMQFAQQSMLLSSKSAYPHLALGNVANVKGDKKGAVAHYEKFISIAGKDSSYTDYLPIVRKKIADTQLEMAASGTGSDNAEAARAAATSLKAYLATGPADASNVMPKIVEALKLAGDTAQIASAYAPLLANPAAFGEFAFVTGGVLASNANRLDDAEKLFEGALAKNPTARDALRNLAATRLTRREFPKVFEPAAKLLSIDPNNNDGWLVQALAYQEMAQAAKAGTPDKKMYTDSLVKYRTALEALPVKVDVVSMQVLQDGATLTLQLEQAAAAAGKYDVSVEFLDAKGAVVAKDMQSVGPIEKGKTARATFKATGAGIVGYRYAPIK